MPPQITRQKNTAPIPTNKSEVISRIKPIGFENNYGLKMLLYGRSGSGKTTLWATFPKPIIALLCSGGNKTGELRSIDTPDNRKNIFQITLNNSEEFRELVAYIKTSKFATVVLDHASGLQDMILKEILGLEELPAQKGWGLATQQQYGQCTLQSKEILRSLLGLDGSVVIIAQEREFNNDSESEIIAPTVGAGLTPSLTGWLNPACDYVCQTFIRQKMGIKITKVAGKEIESLVKLKGVEYCLRTGPDPVYMTKFRIPRREHMPEIILDPTYEKIKALIDGDEDGEV